MSWPTIDSPSERIPRLWLSQTIAGGFVTYGLQSNIQHVAHFSLGHRQRQSNITRLGHYQQHLTVLQLDATRTNAGVVVSRVCFSNSFRRLRHCARIVRASSSPPSDPLCHLPDR